jgi:hypothetical protein
VRARLQNESIWSRNCRTYGVESIDAPSSGRLVIDETRLPEHLQVLGYRRPTHRKKIGEFANRTRSFRQLLEDGATGAVTDRIPDSVCRSVSYHEP